AYVRQQAQAMGLTSVVESVVGIPSWRRGVEECQLLSSTGTTKAFHIRALANSVGGDVTAEVVNVNYFFNKDQGPPPHRFDEGNRKRIVFFSRPLKPSRSLDEYNNAVVQRNDGASWAAEYGAAAVLVRSIQTGSGPPHTGGVTYVEQKNGRKI